MIVDWLADPDGGLTTYSYDAANRIGALLNPFAERTTFAHDALGRPSTQLNANGAWVSYSYDDSGRLTVLANLKSDNTTISSFLYSLDNVGNRTGVTEANGDMVTWSYDDTYQLTREQRSGANAYDITYTYDAVGNRLTKIESGATTTYSYDQANQIQTEETPSQITTFTFDANGNTQVENAGGSLTTYTWSIDNMCVGIALPSGALNTFAYDADLKRRQAQDSAGLAKFINDLDNVLAETDSGGTTQVAYAYEPVQYGNLISQRRSGSTAWHLFDALGSTERLTGSDQAAIVQYLHKAFGLTTVFSGASLNRYTWRGRLGYRSEPDVHQYEVRSERLDPAKGRWLTANATSFGTNYSVAANRPTSVAAPAGAQSKPPAMEEPPASGPEAWICKVYIKPLVDQIKGMKGDTPEKRRLILGLLHRMLTLAHLKYPTAARYLDHFLHGKGKPMEPPWDLIMRDQNFEKALEEMKKKAEKELSCFPHHARIGPRLVPAGDEELHITLNYYTMWLDMRWYCDILDCHGPKMKLQERVHIYDVYDWHEGLAPVSFCNILIPDEWLRSIQGKHVDCHDVQKYKIEGERVWLVRCVRCKIHYK